jgi:hypothetical protein
VGATTAHGSTAVSARIFDADRIDRELEIEPDTARSVSGCDAPWISSTGHGFRASFDRLAQLFVTAPLPGPRQSLKPHWT